MSRFVRGAGSNPGLATKLLIMEAIKITYYCEPIDNFFRMEASIKPHIIYDVLQNVEEWTDDMVFCDDFGKRYSVDDLAGKMVQLEGMDPFIVPTDDFFDQNTEGDFG